MISVEPPTDSRPSDELFAGGGEMGRRMQAFDWSQHPLGPPERWPQSLRTVIRIMLTSRYAMWLGWGPEFWFFCNDAYKPTLGIKETWALGASARKVWAEVWEQVNSRAESVLQTGKATWDEGLRLILERSGYPEETYHTFSYSPVPDDQGETGGLLCVVTEETDRVIGERRLALLRELATQLGQTHTEADVFAEVCRCIGAHPQDLPFALVYSYDAETGHARLECAHGVDRGHLIAPESIDPANSPLWPAREMLADGKPLMIDLSPHQDAVPPGCWDRPAHRATIVPIAQPGQPRPAGFLIVGINPYRSFSETYRGFVELLAGQIAASLSNVRAYEAERRRAAALAELDRAKTEFFSNVSHEFRTPLTLMLGPIEEELRENAGSERLQIAHRNSRRLLKLVNTLLDFSRLEAGRLHATYAPTDLGTFTADLASSFHSVIEKAGLHLQVDCPPLTEPVYVDRDLWEKIVFNLLSNAFKFTFAGTIAVRVRLQGEFVELQVRDTGTGIPPVELPRIFERFHRVSDARSRSHEGTGIGLALVQELARLHGGHARAESIVGQGSTFFVTVRRGTAHLPPNRLVGESPTTPGGARASAFTEEAAQWNTETAEAALPPPPPGAKRARVLLADDNADMRHYVRRLLAEHHDITAVADGDAALAVALESPPDVVLSDVMMPRLDGFGLLQKLRADPRTNTIPVILLSARAGEEARLEGLERSADDYLVKPFSARELLARINTHLDLARIRREAAEQIRESEERFRHVADHSPTIFWVTEPDGHCSYINDRWYEYTGQAPGRALGLGWIQAIHPDDARTAEETFRQANRDQQPFRHEYRLRRHDGAYRWMLDSGAPRYLNGQFTGFVGSLLDVTDQREELEALERNRSQMKLALEAGRSGTFEWEIPSGRVTWSPELERLYGLPPGAFAGTYRAWAQHVVPEDIAAVEKVLQRSFEQRTEEADYEFRAILPDGTHRWLEGKARFIYAANGTPRRMVGINVDIDERKRAQLSTQLLSTLNQEIALLSVPEDMIRAALRALGAHLGVQRCFFSLIDFASRSVTVKDHWQRDAFSPELNGRHAAAALFAPELLPVMASRPVAIDDVRTHPKIRDHGAAASRWQIASWLTAPFLPVDGYESVIGVSDSRARHWRKDEIELLEAVTARLAPLIERARREQAIAVAEDKIRESEQRLRFTLEAAKLGTWDFDPRSGHLVWDARSKELFGFAPDLDVNDATAHTAIDPQDRQRVQQARARALRPGSNGIFDEEYRVIGLPDGTPRWLRANGRVLFENGTAVRFIGILQDITDIVKARETLSERRAELEQEVAERTAKLQETIGELESFSYSISHDLRAPLRAMQSFAQILREESAEQLSPDAQDYLRRIISASDRMDRLIHDVLVYSQVARTELQLAPVDVETLLAGILESYPQLQPGAADIDVSRPLAHVLANGAALTQCLSNLLGNAVKFVAPGTRPHIAIWTEVRGARVRLFVRDNGIGIAPEHREKIFGIFERLSRDYEGTGIGLAVVRKAVERMGGSISFESQPGKGSTFCLELALAL